MGRTWKESDLVLAVKILRDNPQLKTTTIARIYNVPRTTLSNRLRGTSARHDIIPQNRKLTLLEEETIVRHILDLDSRSFPPRVSCVEDMANRLLADRNAQRVGKNWTTNFVRRQSQLRTRFSRQIDYQRAKCEDPNAYNAWFRLVRNTIDKYGILETDTYNFDETGFLMGQISSEMVVTSAKRKEKARTKQQGNREWSTVIQGISADGFAVPPYIIVAGKTHLSSWSENSQLPHNWVITVTANGWTTNERGLDWIQHFDQHTKPRTKGVYRLLILDGHESHHSTDFELYCKDHNIITLCIPAHSSHKLQPLDVRCFRALKRSYGTEIEKLMHAHITHISKEDFFPAFYAAFRTALTESNIRGGFRGTGLVPYDPQHVISQLDIQLSTPTPPPTSSDLPTAWEPKTPHNVIETQSHTKYVKEKIVRHQDSSPTTLLSSVDQFAKGATRAIHELVLLREENATLRKANDELSRRRRTKKRRIQDGGSLSLQDAQDLQAQTDVNAQLQTDLVQSSGRTKVGGLQQRRCRACGEFGHNVRTCGNSKIELNNSDSE